MVLHCRTLTVLYVTNALVPLPQLYLSMAIAVVVNGDAEASHIGV